MLLLPKWEGILGLFPSRWTDVSQQKNIKGWGSSIEKVPHFPIQKGATGNIQYQMSILPVSNLLCPYSSDAFNTCLSLVVSLPPVRNPWKFHFLKTYWALDINVLNPSQSRLLSGVFIELRVTAPGNFETRLNPQWKVRNTELETHAP